MYLEGVKTSRVDLRRPGDNPMYHLGNCVDECFVVVGICISTTLVDFVTPFRVASPFGGVARNGGAVMKGFVLCRMS